MFCTPVYRWFVWLWVFAHCFFIFYFFSSVVKLFEFLKALYKFPIIIIIIIIIIYQLLACAAFHNEARMAHTVDVCSMHGLVNMVLNVHTNHQAY